MKLLPRYFFLIPVILLGYVLLAQADKIQIEARQFFQWVTSSDSLKDEDIQEAITNKLFDGDASSFAGVQDQVNSLKGKFPIGISDRWEGPSKPPLTPCKSCAEAAVVTGFFGFSIGCTANNWGCVLCQTAFGCIVGPLGYYYSKNALVLDEIQDEEGKPIHPSPYLSASSLFGANGLYWAMTKFDTREKYCQFLNFMDFLSQEKYPMQLKEVYFKSLVFIELSPP